MTKPPPQGRCGHRALRRGLCRAGAHCAPLRGDTARNGGTDRRVSLRTGARRYRRGGYQPPGGASHTNGPAGEHSSPLRKGSRFHLQGRERRRGHFPSVSFPMAALAAFCSAAQTARRFGVPFHSICGPKSIRPASRFCSAKCLTPPGAAARSRSQKRRRRGHSPSVSFPIAALAAICSASFLLRPWPWPMGTPFRSTSTEKILAWSGPWAPMSL